MLKEDNSLIKVFLISNILLMYKNIIITGNEWLYSNNSNINILIIIFSLFMYLWVIIEKNRGILFFNQNQLCMFTLIVFLWGITYLFNHSLFSYSFVIEELVFFCTYSVPALIVLPSISKCNYILEFYYKQRYVFLTVILITTLMIVTTGQIQGAGSRYAVYSMSFGRALITPAIIFFSAYFKKKHITDFIFGGVILIVIFLFGSRFPILCIASYIFVKMVSKAKNRNSLVLYIGFGILCGILWFNLNPIVNFLNNLLRSMGIQSRALSLVLNGMFSYDDGRIAIYSELVSKINESPFWGYGAGGGNVILNNSLSHSFVLDVFANLGYFFGGIFLLISTRNIVRLWKMNSSFENREFILMCLCQFLPICFLQLSLWRATHFWYLIAFSIGRLRDRREINE